jgi:hypothetical protein
MPGWRSATAARAAPVGASGQLQASRSRPTRSVESRSRGRRRARQAVYSPRGRVVAGVRRKTSTFRRAYQYSQG